MGVKPVNYECFDCHYRFPVTVTDDELLGSLSVDHVEKCPHCGQRVGHGVVTCRSCGVQFAVRVPHWHVHCDLALGVCPQCARRCQRLCIC